MRTEISADRRRIILEGDSAEMEWILNLLEDHKKERVRATYNRFLEKRRDEEALKTVSLTK